MPKSIIKFPDGTTITIDGTTDEIKNILSHYYSSVPVNGDGYVTSVLKESVAEHSKNNDDIDIVLKIANTLKNSSEASLIEERILNRSSQVNRVILPLYINDKYLSNKAALSSGNIYEILKELGINMALANISKTLSGSAKKYVLGDRKKKARRSVKYKISLPGKKYMLGVLSKK